MAMNAPVRVRQILLGVCVLLLLLVAVVAAKDMTPSSGGADKASETEAPSSEPFQRPRTLFQNRVVGNPPEGDSRVTESPIVHCQNDLLELCVKPFQEANGATGMPAGEFVWDCITTKVGQIKDPICKPYIEEMIACYKDAKEIEGCLTPATSEAVALRRCLRDVKPELLSPACRDSTFFLRVQHPIW